MNQHYKLHYKLLLCQLTYERRCTVTVEYVMLLVVLWLHREEEDLAALLCAAA